MLTLVDYLVIALYLAGVAAFGVLSGGRQKSTHDYFLGGRDLPWWAVCFSIVATETSSLTVISVPAVAFGGSLTFFQMTFGYLAGRILVSVFFLPRYFQGNLLTAYAFLGQRFGDRMRGLAAVVFLGTRVLADGVRLFATAIPVKVIADAAGFEVGYLAIIAAIGLVTILYTYIGGIKAVIWMDVVQMGVYVGGALVTIALLLGSIPEGWAAAASAAGKTTVIDLGAGLSLGEWFTRPYLLPTAVVGGAIFAMASHGTDQLIVQRLLTCRSLGESRLALVASAFLVMVQFALFLTIGLLLWSHYGMRTPAELGLARADEVYPRYIIEGLPPGVSGLILAGILAAAMSTMASSLNSLASSTMLDLYGLFRKGRPPLSEAEALRASRVQTLVWGVVFVGFASLFRDQKNPIVELGLEIASFTYGGLLGVFLLGMLNRRVQEREAMVVFVVVITLMTLLIFGVRYSDQAGWVVTFFRAGLPGETLRSVGWPWYTAIGAGATLGLGWLAGRLLRRSGPAAVS